MQRPSSNTKKFVLRPNKQPAIDMGRAVEMWTHLRQAIIKIQGRCSQNLSFEELYRLSYNLVLHKHGELLYEGVVAVVKEHLTTKLEHVAKAQSEVLLQELEALWNDHKHDMSMISSVLMYMDRTYVSTQRKLLIYDQGTVIFRDVVLKHPLIRGRVRNMLLDAFARERQYEVVDRSRVRNILIMLVDLGVNSNAVYAEEFESPFLEATSEFYAEESADAMARHSTSGYLVYAERRIREERDRTLLLNTSTKTKLMDIVHALLVASHAVQLLEMENSGLVYLLSSDVSQGGGGAISSTSASATFSSASLMLGGAGTGSSVGASGGSLMSPLALSTGVIEERKLTDLRRMYSLFQAVRTNVAWKPSGSGESVKERLLPPLAILRDSMKAFIMQQGSAIVNDAEAKKDPVAFVQSLLDIREKFTLIIDAAFNSDKDFHRALKEGFENVLNAHEGAHSGSSSSASSAPSRPAGAGANVCAEFLSVYVDAHMRTLFRDAPEEEIDAKLNKVIVLFRFLNDKDVFEGYYKAHLQKRLLGGKTANDDAERLMISKLKSECGFQYTSKLEGMFNDLRTSAEFVKGYRAARGPVPHGQVELDVTVLTSGFWPSVSAPGCFLPRDVLATAEAFRAYYLSKHTGRRLTWYTGKGTADIRARIGPSSRGHEITVSTYQMCIMMLFNGPPLQLHSSSMAVESEEAVAQLQLASEAPVVVSFRDMRVALGPDVPVDELKRHVLSLSVPKMKILLKSNAKSKDIDDSETFTVNTAFDSKMFKLKVPLISLKSAIESRGGSGGGAAGAGDKETGDVPEQVEEARKHLLEAAIVRIMKTRKTLDHNSLIAEVMKQVSPRFTPSLGDIKKRIEGLLERDYLERDEDQKQTYHYLA